LAWGRARVACRSCAVHVTDFGAAREAAASRRPSEWSKGEVPSILLGGHRSSPLVGGYATLRTACRAPSDFFVLVDFELDTVWVRSRLRDGESPKSTVWRAQRRSVTRQISVKGC